MGKKAYVTLALGILILARLSFYALPLQTQVAASARTADTLIVNGRIYTSNPAQPWVEAVAVQGDSILAAGTIERLSKYRGAKTQVIDLNGGMAMPGMIDGHTHFLWGSFGLEGIQLSEAASVKEVKKILSDYAKAHPKEKWIYGAGWEYGSFWPTGLPTKALLDEIFPDRPATLMSSDMHSVWVNSKALAAAGITKASPNSGGGARGIIVRDVKTGKPTGVLEEGAKGLVLNLLVKTVAPGAKLRCLRLGMAYSNQFGITGVVNATGDIAEMELYEELHRRGELTVRTTTAFGDVGGARHSLSREELADFEEARRRFHDEWVRAGVIKFFADGVPDTYTAAMIEP